MHFYKTERKILKNDFMWVILLDLTYLLGQCIGRHGQRVVKSWAIPDTPSSRFAAHWHWNIADVTNDYNLF